jgi:hypothetical protein
MLIPPEKKIILFCHFGAGWWNSFNYPDKNKPGRGPVFNCLLRCGINPVVPVVIIPVFANVAETKGKPAVFHVQSFFPALRCVLHAILFYDTPLQGIPESGMEIDLIGAGAVQQAVIENGYVAAIRG